MPVSAPGASANSKRCKSPREGPRVCLRARLLQSCPTLCDPMDVAHQASLSMGSSRQEHWSGLPCPPAGDLPDPGIKAAYPAAPASQVDSLLLSHQGSPRRTTYTRNCMSKNFPTGTFAHQGSSARLGRLHCHTTTKCCYIVLAEFSMVSLCVCLCLIFSYKHIGHVGSGPLPRPRDLIFPPSLL